MTSVLFGNPHVDYWKLSLEGVSNAESVIEIGGELRCGFFLASTPMCLDPRVVGNFAEAVEKMDKALGGQATLQSSNEQSEIAWGLTITPVGHVVSKGTFSINGQRLDFSFTTDQTRLGHLSTFLRKCLVAYDNASAA